MPVTPFSSMKVELPANLIDKGHSMAEPAGVERHSVYFWDLVTFKVENRLFRVPKHPFVSGSPAFAKQHGLLTEDGYDLLSTSADGRLGVTAPKDACILLEDVTVAEFETFLRLMFPNTVLEQGGLPATGHTTSDWLVVLKLSTAWTFIHYRKMAIEQLSAQISDPIDLVKLAREHSVTKWLASAYESLIKREEAMTEEQGNELGLRVAFKLCLLREENATRKCAALPSPMGFFDTSSRPQPPQTDIDPCIQAAFKEELAETARLERVFRTKEEREAEEAARLAQEAREEEARLMKDEAARKARIRLEVEEARARLAAAEEVHLAREMQLQSQRQEVERKAAQLGGPITQTSSTIIAKSKGAKKSSTMRA